MQKEVRKANGKTKLGKTVDPDGMPVKAWKVLGGSGINWLLVPQKNHERRLREMVPISQVQLGFMPERSTTDAIFIARQAYVSLPRAVLWKALQGRGVPERLITVVKDIYKGSKAAVLQKTTLQNYTNYTRGDKDSGHHSGSTPTVGFDSAPLPADA
ncbi:unnamed protein product [Heligmosomoides polygyrus]|uniref:Transposase n=1 Tax=Heligmosomoides polygyrus TaxID=6339 RepID=A0A183GSH9_HELPZ|nr:unnamed protein product [Heligmosomoides polygyrus]